MKAPVLKSRQVTCSITWGTVEYTGRFEWRPSQTNYSVSVLEKEAPYKLFRPVSFCSISLNGNLIPDDIRPDEPTSIPQQDSTAVTTRTETVTYMLLSI